MEMGPEHDCGYMDKNLMEKIKRDNAWFNWGCSTCNNEGQIQRKAIDPDYTCFMCKAKGIVIENLTDDDKEIIKEQINVGLK